MSDDFCKRLAEPFDPAIVSWRVGPTTKDKAKGMALAYIDARDVMRRLDEVCGPEHWQDDYPWSDGKRVVCRIGIKIGDEWIWKTDGAGDTDTEGEKGALSDAFKRSAVKWGIGRYLYDVDSPWVQIEQRGQSYGIALGEYAKLRAALPRPGRTAAPPAGERNADPFSAPTGNGKAHPAAPVADPASTAKHARAVEARDRIKIALDKAETPKLIDEIVDINSADLAFIKGFHEPTYNSLMKLASVRKTEMMASA